MGKSFNVTGLCIPEKHYMVDITRQLRDIQDMVDDGVYFSMNRGRQYGKTTTIYQLKKCMEEKYVVFSISFEGIGDEDCRTASDLCHTVCGLMYDTIYYGEVSGVSDQVKDLFFEKSQKKQELSFRSLSNFISQVCSILTKPVVLIIDEVDQASEYKAFLNFLGMLRDKYLKRESRPTFQSVILAGVYDIKNLKLKIRGEKEEQYNSPWNIAADFNVEMSLSAEGIQGMLLDYETDHHTGMNTAAIAQLIYDYTSGYPYLVSRICKLVDEQIFVKIPEMRERWTRAGVLEAVKRILEEKSTLFDDMRKKLHDFPELRRMFYEILYNGREFPYNSYQKSTELAGMFGYIVNDGGRITISNRIFETWLYNLFVAEEALQSMIYSSGVSDKGLFVKNGQLDFEKILERFLVHYTDLYGDRDDSFHEKEGRKYFLFYLKPIINGTGNYYIEAQTRDGKRTDVIVDYCGRQYVLEMKIWHGEEYNRRGERQLTEYLAAYHLDKGYLLSFNFNKKKQVGMKTIKVNGKTIVEAVV